MNNRPILFFTRRVLFVMAGMLVLMQLLAQQKSSRLFASEELLKLNITGNVRQLLRDNSDKTQYYPISLRYPDGDTSYVIELKARLRGNFRRESGFCNLPPILLNFPKNDTVKNSLFKKQDKLKLVVTCVTGDFVEREYLVYKALQLITPISFKVRLVEITLEGEKLTKNQQRPFIGYFIESENELAARNDGKMLDSKIQMGPGQLDPESYLSAVFFQYMISNVDWSSQFQHNIRLFTPNEGGLPKAIPYDFDHSGLVNAPYAMPPEELNMTSVRERRYRGNCNKDTAQIMKAVTQFIEKKEAILNLYRETKLIDESSKREALVFLEEFFNEITNERRLSQMVSTNCDARAGGNIIIGGLPKTKN
jgi:hypothetical protein